MIAITHPDIPDSYIEVPDSVYGDVLQPRGWEQTVTPEERDREQVQLESEEPLPERTIDAVLTDVGGDPVRAAAALDLERDGKNRKTLVAALERIANPEGD